MINSALHRVNLVTIDRSRCVNLGTGNNLFEYRFLRPVQTTSSTRVRVLSVSIPYSWFNVTALMGNNKFSYVWYDATSAGVAAPADSVTNTGTRFDVTIPDGYYDLAGMNSFLQYSMIQNGHYLIDANGNYVYYIEWVINVNAYRTQLNCYQLPASLPVGWTAGSGVNFTVVDGRSTTYPVPKLILPSSFNPQSDFSLFQFFGFTRPDGAGPVERALPVDTFPPATYKAVASLGEAAPFYTPQHLFCITCSLLDNPLRNPNSQILLAQNVTVRFGADVTFDSASSTSLPLLESQNVSSLRLQLTDSAGTGLLMQDSDISIELDISDLRF